MLKPKKAKLLDPYNKDQDLITRKKKKNIKKLFGGYSKEDKQFLEEQHEERVRRRDLDKEGKAIYDENRKKAKKKKKDIRKANRMQSRALRVLDRPRLSDTRRDKMHDLLEEENKLREKYEKK